MLANASGLKSHGYPYVADCLWFVWPVTWSADGAIGNLSHAACVAGSSSYAHLCATWKSRVAQAAKPIPVNIDYDGKVVVTIST